MAFAHFVKAKIDAPNLTFQLADCAGLPYQRDNHSNEQNSDKRQKPILNVIGQRDCFHIRTLDLPMFRKYGIAGRRGQPHPFNRDVQISFIRRTMGRYIQPANEITSRTAAPLVIATDQP